MVLQLIIVPILEYGPINGNKHQMAYPILKRSHQV